MRKLRKETPKAMMQQELTTLLGLLNVMEEFELKLAELYQACAETWMKDERFWRNMERAEIKHAGIINRVKKIVSEKPDRFALGRLFKVPAIQTMMSGIQWNIQRLRKREITEQNMLFIARDLERSILENSYGQMLRSDDPGFQALVNEIVSDTVDHHAYLAQKIDEMSLVSPPKAEDHSRRQRR
jgi:hypothetical protein